MLVRVFFILAVTLIGHNVHSQVRDFKTSTQASADTEFDAFLRKNQGYTDRMNELMRRNSKSSGADCNSCPEACEAVCSSTNDEKCLTENRKLREQKFAQCSARKR